jgi:hypothetical protein
MCLCERRNFILLPCDHRICLKCFDDMIELAADRRHGFLCPRSSCHGRFAVPFPYNPQCRVRGTVSQPCVRDRYPMELRMIYRMSISSGQKIMGMSLLNDKLYVASGKNHICSFDVSGITNGNRIEEQPCVIPGITCSQGMAASKKLATVYITDWSTMFGGSLWVYRENKEPFKVDFRGEPFGVSVSEFDRLVKIYVTCVTSGLMRNGQILVYEDDGKSYATLHAPKVLKLPSGFQLPHHAVRLSMSRDEELAVCHGWSKFKNHCVSIVQASENSNGDLTEKRSYGTSCMQLECFCCNDNYKSMMYSRLISVISFISL